MTREAGTPGSCPQGGRGLGAVHTRTNTTQRTHMRVGACDAKRGSSMLPSPLAPAGEPCHGMRPEHERTLTCARQYYLFSPPHGGAIEHSPLTPCLPLQARAQESRGFTAGSRAADALGGDTRSRRAVGLRASAPRLAVPSCYKPRVQSASARSTLASGECDLPRSLPTREEAATLPPARAVTPSEEGEGTDR